MTKEPKQLSDCCKAEVVESEDDKKNYFVVCTTCRKPCSIYSGEPKPLCKCSYFQKEHCSIHNTNPLPKPSPEEWERELKEMVESWGFATCPTEEAEPFFWRWSEHGLEMLVEYLKEFAQKREQAARQEEENKWRKILNSGKRMYEMGEEEEGARVVEMVERMKQTEKTIHTPNCQRDTDKNNHHFCSMSGEQKAYNQALSDLQEKLKELEK